ncbi:cellulase [Paraphaeosphaeria sporulosa]|uniref:Glucanase n=1 Tax=Paraphaeosphaeria sporulosa TaxID=1460663 RepID=A0A177CUF7_9PLEO|nr:cellulase [Paraphaeosphaeria sporulosa]OAG10876.1 cellulase [Paraphaeosphaeria sporulosa]
MITAFCLTVLWAGVGAFPSKGEQPLAACAEPVALNASTNIWLSYTLHPHSIYRPYYAAAAGIVNDTVLKDKAIKVAETGTFLWIESNDDILKIDQAIQDVPCGNVLGLVINGLSHAGCDETIGETPGAKGTKRQSESYLESFIAPIARRIQQYQNTAFALIIEPDILPFVVRNPYYKECTTSQLEYRSSIPQALKALDLPNTITYLDAKHAGWFGWNPNRTPYDTKNIARELTVAWERAGGAALKQFRGVSVNVKSYNSWDMSPGEAFRDESAVCADLFNKARNEQRYVALLGQSFKAINSTFPLHAIFDSSRSGVQSIRQYWHDWCNNKWAGLGPRPTLELQRRVHARDPNFDAFVWATPVGFSDGTSEVGGLGWHANCSSEVAYIPMPEKGAFSQNYFETLLRSSRGVKSRGFGNGVVGGEQGVKLERRCDGK